MLANSLTEFLYTNLNFASRSSRSASWRTVWPYIFYCSKTVNELHDIYNSDPEVSGRRIPVTKQILCFWVVRPSLH